MVRTQAADPKGALTSSQANIFDGLMKTAKRTRISVRRERYSRFAAFENTLTVGRDSPSCSPIVRAAILFYSKQKEGKRIGERERERGKRKEKEEETGEKDRPQSSS